MRCIGAATHTRGDAKTMVFPTPPPGDSRDRGRDIAKDDPPPAVLYPWGGGVVVLKVDVVYPPDTG